MFPAPSNFRSTVFGDAWWVLTSRASGPIPQTANYDNDTEWVAELYGPGLASSLQTLMFKALPPSFSTYDSTLMFGNTIQTSGVWNDNFLRSVWGYMRLMMSTPSSYDPQKLFAPTAAMLDVVAADARAQRISTETVRIVIWLTFYAQVLVRTNPGFGFDPPVESVQPFGRVQVSSNAILPVYGAGVPGAAPGEFLYPITTERVILQQGPHKRNGTPRNGLEIPGDQSTKQFDPLGGGAGSAPTPKGLPTWALVAGLAAIAGGVWWFSDRDASRTRRSR